VLDLPDLEWLFVDQLRHLYRRQLLHSLCTNRPDRLVVLWQKDWPVWLFDQLRVDPPRDVWF
jgi:hypothetical protein